jgi:tetratricopeptide (TPR) repeat protein/predicted Ser/Thr protein kinase
VLGGSQAPSLGRFGHHARAVTSYIDGCMASGDGGDGGCENGRVPEGERVTEPADRDRSEISELPEDSTHHALGQARPEVPAELVLAQARVLGAMFGQDSARGRFGRFRVLERLGAGAMGVVYAAYDPDLDRGVALKLVNVPIKERDAALAEAKALARLSHPNVVPIYDVGIEGTHVYLVMELVRGQTLRHWIDGRRQREILDAYQQAGAALAAAHATGLVHRDFKPDNAIAGADGRVRVVDFGLACEVDDPTFAAQRRPAAGTPHFMAPEIAAGAAVTPAADQYSFCVALSDALAAVTAEPVPRRITAVLDRGRADDPAARFPSMTDLLRALARDPARTRRRIVAGTGLAIAVGATAFLVGQQNPLAVDPLASCDAEAAKLDAAWHPIERIAALARIAAFGAFGQELQPLLQRHLDEHARRWATASRAACADRVRGVQSETLTYRRELCVRCSRDAFTRLKALVTDAHPDDLADLARAVQSLPDPVLCSNDDALTTDVAPPPLVIAEKVKQLQTQLTIARVDLNAGHRVEARDAARSVALDADKLAYLPVRAEALLLEGHAQMTIARSDQDRLAAVPILEKAYSVAMLGHAEPIAIEAWARRAWIEGTMRDADRALEGCAAIEPIAMRTRSARFARALLYNNIGRIELARDHRVQAHDAFQRALEESEGVTGAEALELVAIRANLALVTDNRVARAQLLAEAEAERARLLGMKHPDTISVRWLRGVVAIDDLAQASTVLVSVCRDSELHATLAQQTASCWSEVARLHWELGEFPAAIADMEHARLVSPSTVPEADSFLTLWRGDATTAVRQFGDLVARNPITSNSPTWERRAGAGLLLGLGQAQRRAGQLIAARNTLETAVAELVLGAGAHPSAYNGRRLGRARVELALVLASLGASETEVAPVAEAAARWLRDVNSPSRELESLRRRH